MLKKMCIILFLFDVILFFHFSFFDVEKRFIHQEKSMIGLTIDGRSTTTFPSKDSGLAIDNIVCDKGATGVWDYEAWTLKLRNVSQSRTKCQVNFASIYSEGILNGADPTLKEGLVPVIIGDDGIVKKASLGWEWYKYEEKHWANAVILNNESEVYYDGDIIPEEAIESYFVWIPRYKYKIWNMGKYETLTTLDYNQVHIIDVIFGTETTKDTEYECSSPGVSGADGTCSIGKYMTHPAFTSFDTKGMWVGKFETGYKGAQTTSEAQKNENNPSKIQIKPNVYSWRGINVSNAYLSSYNYKRNLDSHMMKNTEWGAVAYLQHSRYGSRQSVRINNNASYMTGYAAKGEPTCGCIGTNEACNRYETINTLGSDGTYAINYFNSVSNLASTTNNYTGIYDMSGGSEEYVMGVMKSQSGVLCSGRDVTYHSGFNGPYCNTTDSKMDGIVFPTNSKYYDVYDYSTVAEKYNRRILGDATGEMGPFVQDGSVSIWSFSSWYADEANFVYPGYPWFHRGLGFYVGLDTGVFSFSFGHGSMSIHGSFRVVLSVS